MTKKRPSLLLDFTVEQLNFIIDCMRDMTPFLETEAEEDMCDYICAILRGEIRNRELDRED